MLLRLIFLAHIWLIAYSTIFCQTTLYNLENLNNNDNLTSQDFNNFINQDKKGFVWISSSEGLNKFDGKTITQYLPNSLDSFTLLDGIILSDFFQVKDDNWWFSSSQSIYNYSSKYNNFKRYLPFDKEDGAINLLFVDTLKKNIYFRINNSLYTSSINKRNKSKFVGSYVLNSNSQLIQLVENKNLLLVSSEKSKLHLTLINPTGIEIENKIINLNQDINIALQTNKNQLLLGGDYDLLKIERIKNDYKIERIESLGDKIVGIEYLKDQIFIVATENKGLYTYNRTKKQLTPLQFAYDKLSKVFNYQILKIKLLKNRYLWISTAGDGVFYTDLYASKFTTYLYESESNSPGIFIRGIIEDKSKNLWIFSKTGLNVLNLEGKIIKLLDNKNYPFHNTIPYDIAIDKNNYMWLSTINGVFYSNIPINLKSKLSFKKLPNINFPAYKINIINENEIIISTNEGVFQINPKELTKIKKISNHNEPISWTLSTDNSTSFIMRVEDKGLILFDRLNNKTKHNIRFKDFINQFTQASDSTKNIWIASSNGLFYLSQNYELYKDNNFPIRDIRGLLQNEKTGNLWLATNKGIVKYNPKTGDYNIFDSSDGLPTTEFNFWSSYKTSTGKFCFGTVNGLVMFDPDEIKLDSTPVNPTITSILINDTEPKEKLVCTKTEATNVSMLEAITQEYQENTLSFRFAALDYTDPDANEFKYRITPTETEWVHSGSENFARYANLAPGDYTFEVDATNSDGIWSNNPAQLDITILPPWYQTWWFRTLAALGIAGVVYLIYRSRVQQIQKEADFKRKEAEYKQLAAETETAVLRLQMNPHFIFNSMNSISSYLLQKDIETANDYLGRFAKLMRKILIVAEEPYLPLYDEIELLEQYMQAEAMRFEEKFQYEFIVADAIDTDEVLIPTMILQPFVENAIWHGISNKKGKGNIEIRFDLGEEKLICSITDNGIGRKAASQKSSSSHESKAITITQRRLNLLVSEHNLSYQPSLVIEDLANPQNQPIGTTVILTLPLI